MLDVMEIMERIPHRYPFLLVDRIIDLNKEEKTITGIKNVTINEDFFNGHFPNHPVMPGVLIVEGLAQCLGVLVMDEGAKDIVPYFAAIEGVRFKAPVRPGDQLVYEAQILRAKRNIVKAKGEVKVDGKVVAEASFTFSMMGK